MKTLASFVSLPWLCAALLLPTPSIAAWEVDSNQDGDGFYAGTLNDSGNYFGQFCFVSSARCYYMVGFRTGCEDKATYPVLVNTDVGAASTELLCLGKFKVEDRTYYRYAFTNFDDIDKLVRGSARIGIAMPLSGDQFRVTRFDLTGSTTALDRMRARANRALEGSTTSPRKTTRDLVL